MQLLGNKYLELNLKNRAIYTLILNSSRSKKVLNYSNNELIRHYNNNNSNKLLLVINSK